VTYGPARARYERRKRRRQRQLANAGFWNILTLFFLFGTILLGAWFVWNIFIKGSKSNNSSIQTPLSISAKIVTSTSTATASNKQPRMTLLPKTVSSLSEVADETASFAFDIQANPQIISARLFRADRKCNWIGVAGQAFDLQGRPVPGISVQVTGPLYGKEIRYLSLTGAAPWYGAAGYEIFLSEQSVDTKGLFKVRLVDQNGKGLSPLISFDTSSDCEKNLAIVNFRQIK
jgi:hypothetical protein